MLLTAKPNTVGDKNSCFAVKKLKMTWNEQSTEKGGQMLAREVKALKRFVDFQDKDKAHHHLIRLLAVYTHRNQLHMILPCADGNLQYFWQEHYPIPNTRDLNLIKWVARQCLGLARALQSIHISHVVGPNAEELEPRFRDQRHGRHGDLKPENILWFGPGTYEGDKEPLGVLVVSDFGLADFHKSQSVNAKGQGYTPTYRAPEWDVIGKVSPAYDIWSLGCVLLEFVVWCIRGWDGVDKFSEKRTDDSESPIPADNFFNFNTTKSVAKAKFSVQRVSHAMPCSASRFELTLSA
jgi:serine/threonine protein kinase